MEWILIVVVVLALLGIIYFSIWKEKKGKKKE